MLFTLFFWRVPTLYKRLGPCGVPYQTLSSGKCRGTHGAAPHRRDRWVWGVALFAPDAGLCMYPAQRDFIETEQNCAQRNIYIIHSTVGERARGIFCLWLIEDDDTRGSLSRIHPDKLAASRRPPCHDVSILTATDSVPVKCNTLSVTVKRTRVQAASCGTFSYRRSRPAGKSEAHSSHQHSGISV